MSAAATGHEALDLMAKDRPDLVLLDVLLQDVNGLDLLRDLRGRYHNLPVIIVSLTAPRPTSRHSMSVAVLSLRVIIR